MAQLRKAAMGAIEDFLTSGEGPVVVCLPFVRVTDVLHPQSLYRVISRERFGQLLGKDERQ